MGTSNFLYNHRLDVISGTSYNAFDFEAYNKGLDECDRLEEGDYDSIGDILHWNLQDTITDLKYRAEEPYRKSLESGISCWKKESVDGFRILSTTEEADDDRKYADRCYGGTQIASIKAETPFFGYNLEMELAVIVRSGYYDGNNIDQVFNLKTDAHCDEYEDYDISSYESAAEFVIEEFDIWLPNHKQADIVRASADGLQQWKRYCGNGIKSLFYLVARNIRYMPVLVTAKLGTRKK